jgi:3D (Asp-Asp-Asp) domain-containing protein
MLKERSSGQVRSLRYVDPLRSIKKKILITSLALAGLAGALVGIFLNTRETPKLPEAPKSVVQTPSFPATYLGVFKITHYCGCPKCVGHKKVIRTKTGTKPLAGKTIAVDPHTIKLGSIVYIRFNGETKGHYYIAEDTGGAIKGNRIDVYVSNHDEGLRLGVKTADVYVLQ